MNPAQCAAVDYIPFLVAAQQSFTGSAAARCQPEAPLAPAPDAFTRLLRRPPPDREAPWPEPQGLARRQAGGAGAGHHPGPALRQGNGTGVLTLERPAPASGMGHQPADLVVD